MFGFTIPGVSLAFALGDLLGVPASFFGTTSPAFSSGFASGTSARLVEGSGFLRADFDFCCGSSASLSLGLMKISY